MQERERFARPSTPNEERAFEIWKNFWLSSRSEENIKRRLQALNNFLETLSEEEVEELTTDEERTHSRMAEIKEVARREAQEEIARRLG